MWLSYLEKVWLVLGVAFKICWVGPEQYLLQISLFDTTETRPFYVFYPKSCKVWGTGTYSWPCISSAHSSL